MIISAFAKPFTDQPHGTYRFLVDDDGVVRVWDEIGGFHTRCHNLSPQEQARIRQLAEEECGQ